MSDVGLARGQVVVVPYQPSWLKVFKAEAIELSHTLSLPVESIQHVGSTAVPDLSAKPIIDIAIRVDSLDYADKWSSLLKAAGYWDKGPESTMPERRFFAKGPEDNRSVYLHVVTPREFERLLTFRDTLRQNGELIEKYAKLKTDLAQEYANDRAQYTHLKNEFIRSVLARP